MGLFSFIGGLFGGGAQKKASRKAEQQQIEAMNRSIAENQRQFDLTRSDFSPYLQAGTGALGGMTGLLGLQGNDVQGSAIDALTDSPLFQSLIRNGEEALLQNASATGGLRGGNIQRGLADFRGDTLSSTIQSQLQNYAGIANMGLGATNSVAGFGGQLSGNISDLLQSQGAVRAGGTLTRGGITAGMWNNAGSFLDDKVGAALPGIGGSVGGILGKLF